MCLRRYGSAESAAGPENSQRQKTHPIGQPLWTHGAKSRSNSCSLRTRRCRNVKIQHQQSHRAKMPSLSAASRSCCGLESSYRESASNPDPFCPGLSSELATTGEFVRIFVPAPDATLPGPGPASPIQMPKRRGAPAASSSLDRKRTPRRSTS